MKNMKHRKVLVRGTAVLGTLLVCGGALTSSPLVMHADDTASTHTETVAPAGTELDNTKWTAVDKAKAITRTIHFVDEKGNTVAPDVVERHTGEVFTTKNGETVVNKAFTIVNGVATNVEPKFAAVTAPSVKGYKLKSTQYQNIPEQGWSLDGKQERDPKTGFYKDLATDEVINVVYTKDGSQANQLKDAVPVSGYTVLSVHNMTRTINYVDLKGTKLHDSSIESVKYETVASDKLTPKEQQDPKNQKVAVVQINKDADGNIVSQTTQIVATPAFKLNDVKSPKIKGYKLQNKKFSVLSGQYMWLSATEEHAHATLDNGLQQFIDQDEIVDVIYVKDNGKADKKKDAKKDQKDAKNQDQKDAKNQDQKDQKDQKGQAAAAGSSDDNGGSGSGSASASEPGTGDLSSDDVGSGDTGDALPQTGNTKASSSILGVGISMLLGSLAMAWDGLKKKFAK